MLDLGGRGGGGGFVVCWGGGGGAAKGRVGLILALQAAERVDAVLYRSAFAGCCITCSQRVMLQTQSH